VTITIHGKIAKMRRELFAHVGGRKMANSRTNDQLDVLVFGPVGKLSDVAPFNEDEKQFLIDEIWKELDLIQERPVWW
jgi:hypothetical protein